MTRKERKQIMQEWEQNAKECVNSGYNPYLAKYLEEKARKTAVKKTCIKIIVFVAILLAARFAYKKYNQYVETKKAKVEYEKKVESGTASILLDQDRDYYASDPDFTARPAIDTQIEGLEFWNDCVYIIDIAYEYMSIKCTPWDVHVAPNWLEKKDGTFGLTGGILNEDFIDVCLTDVETHHYMYENFGKKSGSFTLYCTTPPTGLYSVYVNGNLVYNINRCYYKVMCGTVKPKKDLDALAAEDDEFALKYQEALANGGTVKCTRDTKDFFNWVEVHKTPIWNNILLRRLPYRPTKW